MHFVAATDIVYSTSSRQFNTDVAMPPHTDLFRRAPHEISPGWEVWRELPAGALSTRSIAGVQRQSTNSTGTCRLNATFTNIRFSQ
jgi:hypothetical protein